MTEREDPGDPRPVAPVEPEPDECCRSGCDPCVYDRYWDALDRYERALAEWDRHQAEKIARAMTRTGDLP